MSESNQLAVAPTPALASTQLASFLGIEKGMMIDTIKRQCFKGLNPDQVTDAQLASFISVAAQFRVNPMLPGFLYCYPERNGGIQVMIGPDLMFKLLDENAGIDSWETEVFPTDVSLPPTHAVTKIYRKGKERPISYTAVLAEWKVPSNPNWVTRPRHMIGIRSLKQAARQIVHGLPFDEDERKIAEMQNVTNTATEDAPAQPAIAERPAPPKRAPKGADAVVAATPVKEVIGEAVDVPAEPAPKPVTPPAPAPAAPPTENIQAAMQAREAKVTAPVAVTALTLKPNQIITANCELVNIENMGPSSPTLSDGQKHIDLPTVVVKVKGDYVGDVVMFGAGINPDENDKKRVVPRPEFVAGAKLRLKIIGREIPAKGDKKGYTQARCEPQGFQVIQENNDIAGE